MNASVFNRKKSTEAGFTLVEIAIVLVIIGLLLGGILKGQEMITQAKIKNVINDFNGISVAVTSYQDRYRALPGYDVNVTTRWTMQLSER
jgi:prepilin-type N-terminal cleavage/methylation domain-containing protein